MLSKAEYKGESELIDIAKGKYKKPDNFKDVFIQFKRQLAWQLRKR